MPHVGTPVALKPPPECPAGGTLPRAGAHGGGVGRHRPSQSEGGSAAKDSDSALLETA